MKLFNMQSHLIALTSQTHLHAPTHPNKRTIKKYFFTRIFKAAIYNFIIISNDSDHNKRYRASVCASPHHLGVHTLIELTFGSLCKCIMLETLKNTSFVLKFLCRLFFCSLTFIQ